jgi:hypothetical protein
MPNHAKPPVEYLPPSREVWSRFVRQLRARVPDLEASMQNDLIDFLTTCSKIQARHMSNLGEKNHEQD